MGATGSAPTSTAPPKSTLFCPECHHESSPDGDWTDVTTPWEVRLHCPDCGTEIDRRPRYSADDVAPPATALWPRAWRAWGDSIRTWQSFWERTLDL